MFWNVDRNIEQSPESALKFFIEEQDVDIQFEFVQNDKKQITGLYLIEGAVKSYFKKED